MQPRESSRITQERDYRKKAQPRTSRRWGFTLLELLAVISLVLAMGCLVAPALNSLGSNQSAASAAYEISEILNHARGYALTNNTHVFVGICEENADISPSMPFPRTGIGRVVIAAFASCDGSKGYEDSPAPQLSWKDNYRTGRNLCAIGRLRKFENLHVAASLGAPPETGAMTRPNVNYYYRLGHASCCSVTPITWPLGTGLERGFQYRFEKVIRFDPQGTPRIQYRTNGNTIVRWMEIGLQQTHGNQWQGYPSGPNTGNQTAILIDGLTGTIRIYRPI